MVLTIDEQQPLNICGVSRCCADAFLSREEGLSCRSALSFKTCPQECCTEPHRTTIASSEEMASLVEGQGIPTPKQEQASLSHLSKQNDVDKRMG